MLWKKTIMMVTAFAVLTLMAIVAGALPAGNQGPSLSLPALSEDSIDKVEMTKGGESVTLVKAEGKWLVQPGDYPVDERQLQAALDLLTGVSVGSMVSRNPEMFIKYEVNDDALRLAVYADGDEVWQLLIGKESADHRGNYVRRPEGKTVFVSNQRLRAAFEKPVERWRDHKITDIEMGKVVKLELTVEDRTLVFSRDNENVAWQFVEAPAGLPADYLLDAKKVDQIVRTLIKLTASAFVDEGIDPAEAGLEPAAARATLHLVDGETVSVLVGGEKEKDRYYAKRADSDQVFLIAAYQQKKINQTLASLRDLSVTKFDASKVIKLEIVNEGEKLIFVKEEDKWSLADSSEETPAGFVLDVDKVRRLLQGVARLQGESLIGRSAPAEAKLNRPRGQVIITLDDGSVRQVKIGAETEDNKTYVAGDRGYVYLAPRYAVSNLLKKLDDFKVSRRQAQQQPMLSPEQLQNLPPAIREQFMQQQRQKIMQNQMLRQMMKKEKNTG